LLRDKPAGAVLVQVVVQEHALSGLAGLLKSAAQENPKLAVQLIEVPEGISSHELAEHLRAEATRSDVQVRYRGGVREVRGLQPVETAAAPTPLARPRGVYLVTGGAGGLGLIFAKAMAEQAPDATIVLTGRRALSAQQLTALQQLKADVHYRAVDVNDPAALERLVAEVHGSHGELKGVIHSAGVLRDSFLINKTAQELQEAFAPKVAGLINLDLATRGQALDYFLAFSSTSAELGNIGQTDYAAANAFMDSYLSGRTGPGRSLSVNWPLWADGGMQLDSATRARLWKTAGVVPLGSVAGVSALGQALASNAPQVLVFHGDVQRLSPSRDLREPGAAPAAIQASSASPPTGSDDLPVRVEAALKQALSRQLKLDEHELDRDTEFNEFGLDSIGLTQLGNQLNERYGLELAPTVFFEHPTLGSLSQRLFGGAKTAPAAAPAAPKSDGGA